MKRKGLLRRNLAFLLTAVMAMGIVSLGPNDVTKVQAEETKSKSTIMLGTSGIGNPSSSDSGWSYVYFGTYNNSPVKYRVLDNETTDFSETTMLLDCDTVLEMRLFDGSSNIWASSDIKKYLNSEGDYSANGFLTSSFSALEKAAIAESTTSESEETNNNLKYVNLTNEKIFILDAKEATNTSYGYSNDNSRKKKYGDYYAYWWLRSASTEGNTFARSVDVGGGIHNGFVSGGNVGVSPALNINLSSVLFSSSAEGGKNSSGSLSEVGSYTGNVWKLTLKDASRNTFSVSENDVKGGSGDTVTLNYDGATVGSKEYVSIILEDSNGNLTHYGRVARPADTTGNLSFTLPSLADGTYTLHVFSEQYNGDYKTDYASAFDDVTLTVKNPTQTTDTTDNSNSNDASTSTETTTTETVDSAPITITYTVKKDDYMRKIAREHGITLEQLIALNPQVKNPNLIYAGQILVIGTTGGTASTTTITTDATKTYTVQRGDSLYKIAKKNGMTLAELKSLNENLFAQKYIFAGQTVLLK